MSKCLTMMLLIGLVGPLWAAQDKPALDKPAYPDTADGLKKMFEDILAAAKAADKEKVTVLFKSLVLPNHEAWFKATFGDEVGSRLTEEYQVMVDQIAKASAEEMLKSITKTIEEGRTGVLAFRIEKADAERGTGLQKEALAAMKRPTALYTVKLVQPGQSSGLSLWSFVYVDNGFRNIGKMRALHKPAASAPAP